ncbi:MAG: hypothetical protein PHQ35_10620 [Phycisphaerae bacterium]|nr:hypothetical protein [Phycisphaerae bacterium]
MELIARSKIQKGDVVKQLWKRFCRPAIVTDYPIKLLAMTDARKGENVFLLVIRGNEHYELGKDIKFKKFARKLLGRIKI